MNCLLIGFGRWGQTVARNFPCKLCPDNKLYIIDSASDFVERAKNATELSHAIFLTQSSKSLIDIVNTHKIQAVYVATPMHTHKSILQELPQHCVIPILFEKPSFHSSIEISNYKRRCNIAVGHVYLQSDGFKYLKNKICQEKSATYIVGHRLNTTGPIRCDSDAFTDLGIHDIYLFWDLVKHRYEHLSCVHSVKCEFLYKNKFSARFNLSYKDLYGDFSVSWTSEYKTRDWFVQLTPQLVWDGEHDTVASIPFTDEFTRPTSIGMLEKQWMALMDVAIGKPVSECNLHNLDDAYMVRLIMEHAK
jgi:predicted dehydrogenase